MDFKRKSIKKKQIKVEYVKVNGCNCLLFTLDKPFYKVIIGATNTISFCDIPSIAQKICAVFHNSTRDYVYCMEEDIKKEVNKMEKEFLKD
jgi:hypothetical protein